MDMEQLYVIHLKRRNTLRTLLSQKIYARTKVLQRRKGSPLLDIESRKVAFTYERLVKNFSAIKSLEDEFDDKFRLHPVLNVHYEDLVASPDSEFEHITNFLGLPFSRPRTHFAILNPEKLSVLLLNYEQLKKEFSGTEWAHFFEEKETASAEL